MSTVGKEYLQHKATSHSISITYLPWVAEAPATGLLTPGPHTAVLPWVYSGLPGHVGPPFMAAIAFCLVVKNRRCKRSHKILFPTTLWTSNWAVPPGLAFQPGSNEQALEPLWGLRIPQLHSSSTEQQLSKWQSLSSVWCPSFSLILLSVVVEWLQSILIVDNQIISIEIRILWKSYLF